MIPKSTSNREFLFGDADKDGVKNVDDKFPLNKNIALPVSEVKLSDELKKLRMLAFSYRKDTFGLFKNIRALGYKAKYRVKNVNSIINKMRRRAFPSNGVPVIQDVGGIMILTKSPQESYNIANYIKNNYRVIARDNYYKKPLSGYYRALHYTVLINNKPIEVQIKARKESKLHLRAHTLYKTGKLTPSISRKLRKEVQNIEKSKSWW